jgi:hypothetical protein
VLDTVRRVTASTQVDQQIRIGALIVDRGEALESAGRSLSRRARYAYPGYDAFASDGGPFQVSDADLVAPVLLNAHMNSRIFYALQTLRPHLEAWLATVPPDARLVEAGAAELSALGDLFAVLDSGELRSTARGSVVANVMHRKRPSFVPLYDRMVDHCYRGAADAPAAPSGRGRSWQEFFPVLAGAVAEDLRSQADFFAEVADLAAAPRITSLRALDIVAWHAGRSVIGKRIWREATSEEQIEDEDSQVWLDEVDEQP